MKHEPDIIQQVLTQLGKPPNYLDGKITYLWDNYFRVNIYGKVPSETEFMPRIEIIDSFFIETSDDGKIIRSTPEIKPKYHERTINQQSYSVSATGVCN